MDINFKLGDNTFNFRVCGIIRNKDKILVSVSDDKNYSSLIGGRVMASEDSINALIREVKEESGFQAIYKKTVGFIENFYILTLVIIKKKVTFWYNLTTLIFQYL